LDDGDNGGIPIAPPARRYLCPRAASNHPPATALFEEVLPHRPTVSLPPAPAAPLFLNEALSQSDVAEDLNINRPVCKPFEPVAGGADIAQESSFRDERAIGSNSRKIVGIDLLQRFHVAGYHCRSHGLFDVFDGSDIAASAGLTP